MILRSVCVTIPAPTDWLSSNDRLHRQVEARLISTWRAAASRHAWNSRRPQLGLVHLTAEPAFPIDADGKVHVRDTPNLYPTIKAAIDGLVDVGLLADDSDRHIRSLTIRPGKPLPHKPYGPIGVLTLTLEEVPL